MSTMTADGIPKKTKEKGIQVNLPIITHPPEANSSRFRKCSFACCSVSVLVLAIVLALCSQFLLSLPYRLATGGFYVPGELVEDIGVDGIVLFKQHDRNNDGVLSLDEFEPLAHRIIDVNVS